MIFDDSSMNVQWIQKTWSSTICQNVSVYLKIYWMLQLFPMRFRCAHNNRKMSCGPEILLSSNLGWQASDGPKPQAWSLGAFPLTMKERRKTQGLGLGPGPGPAIPSPYCLRHWESKKELAIFWSMIDKKTPRNSFPEYIEDLNKSTKRYKRQCQRQIHRVPLDRQISKKWDFTKKSKMFPKFPFLF